MKYYIVSISNGGSQSNELSKLAFDRFGSLGQNFFNLEEEEVDSILGSRAFSGGDVTLEIIEEVEQVNHHCPIGFYFEENQEAIEFYNYVTEQYSHIKAHIKEEEGADWNECWRKHFKPIEVKDVVTIYPEWMAPELNEREIKIYPGQGFGTGSHETTWLCLEHCGRISKKTERCLDFGCGSGILGIAATKIFKCLVDYCDIDRAALDNCVQNIVLNFPASDLSGSKITIRERFVAEQTYDLVFANILLNVLIEEKDLLIKSVNRGGYMIVSGILKEQTNELIDEFSSSLEVIYHSSKKDWSAITFRKI